jgi:4-hydroxy-tetrahydrodipicolinate reductase
MVRIGVIGYGKMGQLIEQIALEQGHEVNAIIDPLKGTVISKESLKDVDVCIDFSLPQTAISNIEKLAKLGKNIVVGTTGWYNEMGAVKKIVTENNIGLIWSGNFSLGVNAFFKIIKNSSKIFNKLENYDIMVHEFHHKNKADSPSGTAKMIAQRIIENVDRKDTIITNDLQRKIKENELHVSSTRGGSIPGTHLVLFDSDEDTIELKHTARSRVGFAVGAIKAAEFLNGKKGFFSIDDLMKDIFGSD